jgi:hypothetical protein
MAAVIVSGIIAYFIYYLRTLHSLTLRLS